MKNFTLVGLMLGYLLMLGTHSARADDYDSIVNKFAIAFNGGDGTGQMIAAMNFAGAVPLKDRSEVIARILDKLLTETPVDSEAVSGACQAITMNNIAVDSHLEKTIDSLTKNTDPKIRAPGLTVMAEKEMGAKKELILAFQNDKNDEIRSRLMDEIKLWPDGESILLKYIQAHEKDPNYKKSVEFAEISLAINRQTVKKTRNEK